MKTLGVSSGVYILGALLDDYTTWKYVVVEKTYEEANKNMWWLVYHYPVYIWFFLDLVFLSFAILVSYAFGKFIMNNADSEKVYRIGEKWCYIVSLISLVRLAPGLHNLLLVCHSNFLSLVS